MSIVLFYFHRSILFSSLSVGVGKWHIFHRCHEAEIRFFHEDEDEDEDAVDHAREDEDVDEGMRTRMRMSMAEVRFFIVLFDFQWADGISFIVLFYLSSFYSMFIVLLYVHRCQLSGQMAYFSSLSRGRDQMFHRCELADAGED